MQRWKKFWRLRRQDDAVKAMLLFLIAGMAFLINAVYNGVLLYQQLKTPAEYVLSCSAKSGTADSKLEALRELGEVTAVSRQSEVSVTVRSKGEKFVFSCTELSGEYMETVYGIRESGAMKTFYMNEKAYRQLKQEMNGADSSDSNADLAAHDMDSADGSRQEELQVRYLVEEETANQELISRERTARVVLVKEGVPAEEVYVCCKGGSQKTEHMFRTCVGEQELNGGTAKRLQNMGFDIENMEEVQEAEYEQKIKIVRMGYGMMTGSLCLLCVWVVWRVWKRGHRSV